MISTFSTMTLSTHKYSVYVNHLTQHNIVIKNANKIPTPLTSGQIELNGILRHTVLTTRTKPIIKIRYIISLNVTLRQN